LKATAPVAQLTPLFRHVIVVISDDEPLSNPAPEAADMAMVGLVSAPNAIGLPYGSDMDTTSWFPAAYSASVRLPVAALEPKKPAESQKVFPWLKLGDAAPWVVHDTVVGLPATVTMAAEAVVIADVPIVAVMVVESPWWLLGAKEVVALLADVPVVVDADVGDTVAVKPAVGAVVTAKVIGTPAWFVLSVAVIVSGAVPAV